MAFGLKEIQFAVKEIAKERDEKEYDAFVYFVLRDIVGLEEGLCEEAITGGSKDCGIDAFWTEGETINILQAKYFDEGLKISDKEIDHLWGTLDYLEAGNGEIKDRCKKFILEKSIEYKEYKDKGYSTQLIIASTAKLSPAAIKKMELRQKESEIAKMVSWAQDELVEKYFSVQSSEKPNVELKALGFFEMGKSKSVDVPYVVATIRATELCRAYGKFQGAIFAQNLRYYLGSNKINKEIKSVLTEGAREKFWYYNNGLTIVCDDYKIENNVISISNIQIVNGAQTTSSLYESYLKLESKMDDVSVVARIIKVRDDLDLVDRIREYNNKQNPTKARDFVAHDPIQRRLQRSFEPLKVFYEIARGEKNERPVASKVKYKKLRIVDNLTVAQAQCAFLGMPAEAKSKKNDLLNPSDDYYGKIFDDAITPQELWFSYLCYEKAKHEYLKYKRENPEVEEEMAFMIHGTTQIVSFMGVLAKKTLRLSDYFENPEKFDSLISENVIEFLYVEARDMLSEFYSGKVQMYKPENKLLVASKYFKNSSDATALNNLATKRVEKKLSVLKDAIKEKIKMIKS